MSNFRMPGFRLRGLVVLIGLLPSACILRPGMNADCAWPPEATTPLDLTSAADRRHLVVDTELVEELVDRYRFHVPNEQPACRQRLIATVARTHSLQVSDVARARASIPDKGLNLPVNVPVLVFFLWAVLGVTRRIEQRFSDEVVPQFITLTVASAVLGGVFILIGEFWTSILQMIRVGSQHVGGRILELPWRRHEPEIFVIAIVLFWIVVLLRQAPASRGKSRVHPVAPATNDRGAPR